MTSDDEFIDSVLSEYWSYTLYKRGKEPFQGDDPSSKIRKGIWRDEGVDLTVLARSRGKENDIDEITPVFRTETIVVKEGIFRRKKEHTLIVGNRGLSKVLENLDDVREGRSLGFAKVLLSSDILFPLATFDRSHEIADRISDLRPARRRQFRVYDPDPATILKRRKVSGGVKLAGENIKDLYLKKVDKEKRFKKPGGIRTKTLKNVLEFLFTCSKRELASVIEEGQLVRYASEGLSSNVMEALFRDLSEDPSGQMETPENFRTRLGRWLMESPLGDTLAGDLVPILIRRLETCSAGESNWLRMSISSLMDTRSTSLLIDKVFSVEPEKRPFFILLLGATGDRAAVEPLQRLRDYSNLKDDRDTAMTALKEMGAGS